ncbi:MAG: glycoside hydrolase, partial [Bacteroidetes bacterium]|nr:glycoside hydrolase [Bacteroidota bacterium]
EEPAGQNPPDGAVINYYLKSDAKNVTLEILDNAGTVLRKYSNQDQPYAIPEVNIPLYWILPQQILSAKAGSHRFLWDIRLTPLDVEPSYPISATYMNTAPEATAPWVMPGTYQVKLTVDGTVQTQSLTVRMDPRVTTGAADLQMQYDLAVKCYNARKSVAAASKEIQSIRSQIGDRKTSAKGAVIKSLDEADQQLHKLARFSWGSSDPTLGWLDFSLASLFSTIEDADLSPTAQAKAAVGQLEAEYNRLMPTWKQWKEKSLPALNAQLKKSGLKAIQ